MATLPVEVLLLIFPQLLQRDLLECMVVCKPWNKIIQQHALFRDIRLDNQIQLTKLIRRVIRDPSLGARVDRLTIDLTIENGFDILMLADLFPNVREFRLINLDEYYEPDETLFENHPSHPWCNRIEKLVDCVPWDNTKSLLKSGLCKNLAKLSLLGNDNSPPVNKIIKLLDNAPSLMTLELRDFDVTSRDLEFLHSVAPAIQSIFLRNCSFDFDYIPHNIKPATSVKSFRSWDSESISFNYDYQYIRYIAEKYSHLEELAFDINDFPGDPEHTIDEYTRIQPTLVSYLMKLGTRLKSLRIRMASEDSEMLPYFDFITLDNCGCKIELLELGHTVYMSIMEQLSRTNQVKYIRSLSVNNMGYDPESTSQSISLQWIACFKNLKELSLHFPSSRDRSKKRHVLNLPELLDPLTETQVEILRIENAELYVKTGDTPRTYPFVKDLSLENVELQPHTDIDMAKLLPNLKRLTLDDCLKDRKQFSFPNLELSYLQISQLAGKNRCQVLVITEANSQQRLYTVNKNPYIIGFDKRVELQDIFSLPPVTSEPYNGSTDFPFVTITCKSLSQFFMSKKGCYR